MQMRKHKNRVWGHSLFSLVTYTIATIIIQELIIERSTKDARIEIRFGPHNLIASQNNR